MLTQCFFCFRFFTCRSERQSDIPIYRNVNIFQSIDPSEIMICACACLFLVESFMLLSDIINIIDYRVKNLKSRV